MVRINISIDKNELKELDEVSKIQKQSRSKIVRDAIQLYKSELERYNAENTRRHNILKAIQIQDELKQFTRGWDGVSEIRKWRESR